MKASLWKSAVLFFPLLAQTSVLVAANDSNNPTWWDKYTYLAKNGPLADGSATGSISSGSNVDVSNECGPQSETFITLDTRNPKSLAAGSNEIFRLPMRGYYSNNSGKSWGAWTCRCRRTREQTASTSGPTRPWRSIPG